MIYESWLLLSPKTDRNILVHWLARSTPLLSTVVLYKCEQTATEILGIAGEKITAWWYDEIIPARAFAAGVKLVKGKE